MCLFSGSRGIWQACFQFLNLYTAFRVGSRINNDMIWNDLSIELRLSVCILEVEYE